MKKPVNGFGRMNIKFITIGKPAIAGNFTYTPH